MVIISPAFIRKPWPQRELSALVAREMAGDESVILPVWHDVTREQVREFSLPLADVLAVDTAKGLEAVVAALRLAVIRRRLHESRAGHSIAASDR